MYCCFNVLHSFRTVDKPQHLEPCTYARQISLQSPAGYISNALAASHDGWGSYQCPWILTALPGQVINITIIDFHPSSTQSGCEELGYITDRDNGHEVTICKSSRREQHLFTSTGLKVEIKLQNNGQQFLLQYTGVVITFVK